MNTHFEKLPVELAEYCETLLNNGFSVLVPTVERPTWVHFAKDNKIGYVQYTFREGFSFSTVHKPCKEFGTGFSVKKQCWTPTIEDALKTFVRPSWSYNMGGEVRKYSSLSEYATKQGKWSNPVTVEPVTL